MYMVTAAWSPSQSLLLVISVNQKLCLRFVDQYCFVFFNSKFLAASTHILVLVMMTIHS